MKDRIRIFSVLNHLGNTYEQLKITKNYPVKISYLENNVRRWNKYSPRPLPETMYSKDEFEWVTHYEPGKYDLAILAVDQQHVNPDLGKGSLYEEMNVVIQDIPKLVINHGTPMYDEMYSEDIVINGGEVLTKDGMRRIKGMKEKIGDNPMVVNSYDSVARWGWGYPLIHGMDADEWWDLPKEPRVTISLSPGGLDKYYNRSLLAAIKTEVKKKTGLEVQHIMQNYRANDWDDYRQFIGKSLIYINPTLDSPMPRSRTEAMLSGCCVLTSKHHNADEFIDQGKHGLIVPDNPISYAETIYQLIFHNYEAAIEIGQAGKERARNVFSHKRYQKDLYDIITKVIKGEKLEWKGEKIW